MIKAIHITKYKKLSDVDLEFCSGVNAISGTNGTCKSSLLHVASNAFQSVSSGDSRIENSDAIRVLNSLNNQVNLKIEKLAKGDREYNDPAPGVKGTLFEVEYFDGRKLAFRRHNSGKASRYAVKPEYATGKREALPSIPVVYLGLARLLPWGEYQDDESIVKPRIKFPEKYLDELTSLYKSLTGIDATAFAPQKMGSVKNRQEFGTDVEGIDSNTISSGEDNVLIILTALLSLKLYYESLMPEARDNEVVSMLLIDEFDATLHPSLQHSLLEVLDYFSDAYRIQIIFTTHSIYLLDQMFNRGMNVIYLMDMVDEVERMPDPDSSKIEMYLTEKTRNQVLADKIIPVFTEDSEARLFADVLLTKFCEMDSYCRMRTVLHFVDANFGAKELRKLFNDVKMRQSSMAAICLLDGDQSRDLSDNILVLPGGKSPELVAFDYAIKLSMPSSPKGKAFWVDRAILAEGFNKAKFVRERIPEIKKLQEETDRKKVKQYFNKYITFFRLVLKAWVYDSDNDVQIRKFANDLVALYRKTAPYHGLHISASDEFNFTVAE